ncbi:hypothetical protein [Anabaena azotica]|uniref:Secreted protein n=1 Tax=Anabaena azotica FACHB-119 TaxID=947527 RepID=A0ABR8D9H3_9NOST|nr:hypothetical protein [Anabaena azotica]MBD2503853.1 hypothetical protein [Anabaena azotica FACHB-119]
MKRFLIFAFTPTFVSHCVGRVSRHKASGGTRCADLYYLSFQIRSSPLDLLRLLFVRFTAISYTTTKAALEGRGFKPSFSVIGDRGLGTGDWGLGTVDFLHKSFFVSRIRR